MSDGHSNLECMRATSTRPTTASRRRWALPALLAAALLAPLAFPQTAAADPPWGGRGKHGHGYGYGPYHHRHGYAPYGYVAPGVYVGLPPVVFAPPPPVIIAPPAIVVSPGTVIAQAPRVRCRSWTGSVVIGGQVQPAYGTQCLMPDGTWRLVD